jgi:uncharacterized DUF497 family protein
MPRVTFEWDEEKNRANQEKHGVSFEQAQRAFLDPERRVMVDAAHSKREPRLFCLGRVDDRVVTVRFTYRADRIRIIGAGYWRKGRKAYGQPRG